MAEIYDTDRFAKLQPAAQNPPVANLGLAAKYLVDLFAAYQIPYAFLGGWAVYLRGSGRRTNDVDISVGCEMRRLVQILAHQSRLSVPQRHGATTVQIFIHTGGTCDPGYQAQPVSVDIIIGGYLGTPANMPAGTEEIVPVMTAQGQEIVRVIDLFYQVSAKLGAFASRQSRNDYIDLDFLVRNNHSSIWNFQPRLNPQHCRFYVDTYASENRGSPVQVERLRQLFGVGR